MDGTTHDFWYEKTDFVPIICRKALAKLHRDGYVTRPMGLDKFRLHTRDIRANEHPAFKMRKIKSTYVPKNYEDKRIHG